jgi:hypothetical protein
MPEKMLANELRHLATDGVTSGTARPPKDGNPRHAA